MPLFITDRLGQSSPFLPFLHENCSGLDDDLKPATCGCDGTGYSMDWRARYGRFATRFKPKLRAKLSRAWCDDGGMRSPYRRRSCTTYRYEHLV